MISQARLSTSSLPGTASYITGGSPHASLPDGSATHCAFGFKLSQLNVDSVARYVQVRAWLDNRERLPLQQAQDLAFVAMNRTLIR